AGRPSAPAPVHRAKRRPHGPPDLPSGSFHNCRFAGRSSEQSEGLLHALHGLHHGGELLEVAAVVGVVLLLEVLELLVDTAQAHVQRIHAILQHAVGAAGIAGDGLVDAVEQVVLTGEQRFETFGVAGHGSFEALAVYGQLAVAVGADAEIDEAGATEVSAQQGIQTALDGPYAGIASQHAALG